MLLRVNAIIFQERKYMLSGICIYKTPNAPMRKMRDGGNIIHKRAIAQCNQNVYTKNPKSAAAVIQLRHRYTTILRVFVFIMSSLCPFPSRVSLRFRNRWAAMYPSGVRLGYARVFPPSFKTPTSSPRKDCMSTTGSP